MDVLQEREEIRNEREFRIGVIEQLLEQQSNNANSTNNNNNSNNSNSSSTNSPRRGSFSSPIPTRLARRLSDNQLIHSSSNQSMSDLNQHSSGDDTNSTITTISRADSEMIANSSSSANSNVVGSGSGSSNSSNSSSSNNSDQFASPSTQSPSKLRSFFSFNNNNKKK